AENSAQPLAANVRRVLTALAGAGHPLPEATERSLAEALQKQDAEKLQALLDPHVLFIVDINPELRVRVSRGSASAILQQSGFTPSLVKINNHAAASQRLNLDSPQAGPVYAGAALGILERQQQT